MAKLLNLIKDRRTVYWGIGFLLFFIPVYPKFPLISVSGTYVSIRLEDIFVSLLIGIFLLGRLLDRDVSLLKKNFSRFIFLYFSIGFLSLVSGFFITKNIVFHLAFLHWLRRVEYISLLFLAYFSFDKLSELKKFGKIVYLSTLGVIIYGLGQKFFGWPVVSTMNKEFSKGMILKLTWWARVNSTFAGHYDLAAYMVLVLCLIFGIFTFLKNLRQKIALFVLGALAYYILILTASRVSFVAYLAGVLFILAVNKKWVWIFPFLGISVLGMIFSADLGQRYAATFKINLNFLSGLVIFKTEEIASGPTIAVSPTLVSVKPILTVKPGVSPLLTATPTPTPTSEPVAAAPAGRFESTEMAVDRSTNIRLKVEWPRAIAAFLKNPLLGTGYSSITLATDNDYLRMLGETGLLGSLAFMAVVLELFFTFVLQITKTSVNSIGRKILIGIVGAGIGYFANAVFIDVLEASKIAFFFWIMMGVGLKVAKIEEDKIIK